MSCCKAKGFFPFILLTFCFPYDSALSRGKGTSFHRCSTKLKTNKDTNEI